MKTYLQEAFQAMNLLEGEDFSLASASVKDILDFKDNDEELNILNITDPDTTEEDDLKDSYVGNVILECEVCHSPIFKNVEDVVIDEDSDLANIEDECPICHSNDGFTIIGQVAPYQEEPELEVEIEDKEISDDEVEDTTDNEIEDYDDDIVDDDEEIKESLTEADGSAAEISDEEEDEFAGVSMKKSRDVYDAITACLFGHELGYRAKDRRILPDKAKGEHAYGLYEVASDIDDNIVVWQSTIEDLKFAAKVGRYFKLNDGVEFEGPVKESNSSMWGVCRDKNTNEKIEAPYRVTYFVGHLWESLREGFEKVDLEMEDKIIHVSEEEKDPIPEAEMITPVSDELETELLADNTEMPIDAEMEDEPMIDEPMLDEPVEDDLEAVDSASDDIDLAADDDEIDYDIDDFEEDDFDELGESYLKEVYDNVKTFKTSNVSLKNEQLIVEGVIGFNSGKSKTTQFIFEAKDATKTGSVRFVGENKQISRGKKAFELRGKMQGSKFIAESLNYNYRAKNSDGQSTRLYGTVKTAKH